MTPASRKTPRANAPMLTIDQLTTPPTLKEEVVTIKRLGGAIRVRELTVAEVQILSKQCVNKFNTTDGGKKGEVNNDLLQMALVEHGVVEPKLSQGDVIKMRAMPAGAFTEIVEAVKRVNGMTEEAAAQADAAFPSEE